jgi:hypothetical protein
MKLSPYHQFYSIRKDLLKRSQAEVNRKPMYKVRGKSAKVLERELIKVKVRFGATKFGYSFCCTKPQCVFCGELGTLRYKLYQHKEQYSPPRIFKPKVRPHEAFVFKQVEILERVRIPGSDQGTAGKRRASSGVT